MIAIGGELRRLRIAKGMSQGAAATKAGLQRSYIYRVEKGRISPSIGRLERLAHALDVKLWELFCTGEPLKPQRYSTDLRRYAQARGTEGEAARFFLKLKPVLARIPEKNRRLFLSLAEELAMHPSTKLAF